MHGHLGHHTGCHCAAVQRIQALLNFGQIGDAVVVGVPAVNARANDVFCDVGQAVTVGVEYAAMTIRQHEAGHDPHAILVQRQAAQGQRSKGQRRDLGGAARGLAVAPHLRHAVGHRVIHQQGVVSIRRQEDVHLAVTVGAATQFDIGRTDHVVSVGGQARHVGAVNFGGVLVKCVRALVERVITDGKSLQLVESGQLRRQLGNDLPADGLYVVKHRVGGDSALGRRCQGRNTAAGHRRRRWTAAAGAGSSTDESA